MTDNADDFLAHYGVKGMKWGVRKDRKARASSSDPKTKKTKTQKARANAREKSRKSKMRTVKSKILVSTIAGGAVTAAGALWLNKQFTGKFL